MLSRGGAYPVFSGSISGAGLWDISGNLNVTAGSPSNSRFTILLDSLTSADTPGLLANFDPTHFGSWTFLQNAGINGFSASEFALNTTGFNNALNGGSFSLVSDGRNLALDFTPGSVPEPGSIILFGSGVLTLYAFRRKTRNSLTGR